MVQVANNLDVQTPILLSVKPFINLELALLEVHRSGTLLAIFDGSKAFFRAELALRDDGEGSNTIHMWFICKLRGF